MNAHKALFVFPTPYEAQKVFSLFMGRRRMPEVGDEGVFELSGEKFAGLVCGYASSKAAVRVEEAVSGTNPENVLLCGFCGACVPDLAIGEAIVDSTSEHLVNAARLAGAKKRKICAYPRVADNAAKETLARESGADAVDMESAFVRDLCGNASFASFRVVSDAFPSECFPSEFLNALVDTHSGKSRPFAAAWELVKKPSRILWLMRFAKNMGRVREIYDEYIEKFVFEISKLP